MSLWRYNARVGYYSGLKVKLIGFRCELRVNIRAIERFDGWQMTVYMNALIVARVLGQVQNEDVSSFRSCSAMIDRLSVRQSTVQEAIMTLPNKTERQAIVDTHRHPIGPKLAAKMAERGFYDPKQEFPQTNAQDLIGTISTTPCPSSARTASPSALPAMAARSNGLRGTYLKSARATPSKS